MNKKTNTFYPKYGKHLFDIALALPTLIVLSPVMVCITMLVWAKLGRPVFFKQVRSGMGGRPFTIYKFRTMIDRRDGKGNLLSDDRRLTRFGCFMRSTSMDELTEIFNILRGDMSIVGPRPLLMQYLYRYTPDQARRHLVKPGLTGWAQIKGRNAITWEEKFKLDVWYVDNMSLLLDFRIILATLGKILKREGISADGAATMPEFMGTIGSAQDRQKSLAVRGQNMGTNSMGNRFENWKHPKIKEGKLTKYNWVVQHIENFRLGYRTDIGAFTYINAKNGVTIEDNVQIGSHCSIYSVSTIDEKRGPVLLKRNCRIGAHATIMPGVTVGENAVVGAHSFVNRDVPDGEVVMGVPTREKIKKG